MDRTRKEAYKDYKHNNMSKNVSELERMIWWTERVSQPSNCYKSQSSVVGIPRMFSMSRIFMSLAVLQISSVHVTVVSLIRFKIIQSDYILLEAFIDSVPKQFR